MYVYVCIHTHWIILYVVYNVIIIMVVIIMITITIVVTVVVIIVVTTTLNIFVANMSKYLQGAGARYLPGRPSTSKVRDPAGRVHPTSACQRGY